MVSALVNGVKGGVWYSLMDKVYAPKTLEAAWKKVRANRGSAGVAGQSIERFAARPEAYLAELGRDLRTGDYRPEAIRRVEIPKGDGTARPLGIPAVKDRIAESVSVRKAAKRAGVSVPTAFRWRHRFLSLAKASKAEAVSGIVEADETFFLRSFKGARQMSRAPRKRGGKASKPGLSDEQVPVLVLRDRSGATADGVLESLKVAEFYRVLTQAVAKDTVLVSDGARAYASFAAENGMGYEALDASKGERSRGVFHIQNVNAYHSRLKTWMRRFNGVATKYLPSYLGWRRLFEHEGDDISPQRCLLAALA